MVIITVTSTPSAGGSATSSSATPTQTKNSDDSSSGLGTGSIIGLSVAGGVALLGIIGFCVWKFTRKRYGDFDDGKQAYFSGARILCCAI